MSEQAATASPLTLPSTGARTGHQHEWYFKINDPARRQALLLRFTVLVSANGFRRSAEVWAVFWRKSEQGEVEKSAVRKPQDLSALHAAGEWVKVSDCEFSGSHLRGSARSQGATMSWDLRMEPAQPLAFDLVPESLARLGLIRNRARTPQENLLFSGSYTVDGTSYMVDRAPGMHGILSGPLHAESWTWGHCNHFVDPEGNPTDLVFEGLSARSRLPWGLRSPRLTSLFFHYRGVSYPFNRLIDSFRIRSSHSLTEWRFQADRGEVSFRGHLRASLKDFAGLTLEDTDGTLLSCSTTLLSDLSILIYRRGKLESTHVARDCAAFEVAGREKNPYVPPLL
ncbi:MAG TPA: hypothetical protein VL588_06585 [Bdellovibrionota bacterium]|jgi:hypothetical protein|nr:hypothetical protein [Bdellovibrionota bacterium]